MRPFLPMCAAAIAIVVAAGCSERPGGAPIVSLAECAALGGQAVLDPGDAGASNGCGDTGILIGYLEPDEVGPAGGICCE